MVVAGLASVIALALTPVTPAGVPVVVASFAALLGLKQGHHPMSTWLLILALALGTVTAKVIGPLTAGGRSPLSGSPVSSPCSRPRCSPP